MDQKRSEILRMGQVLKILGQEFLLTISQKADERRIHTQKPAVHSQEGHAVGGMIESVLEERSGRHK
jgi:hypothetical protein